MLVEHLYMFRNREFRDISALVVIFLADDAVRNICQARVFRMQGGVYLLVAFAVDRTEILVSYLYVFQWEGLRMPVFCPERAPDCGGVPDSVFYGIERVLYICVKVHFRLDELPRRRLEYPACADHAGRDHVHGVGPNVFAKFVEFMVADSVGAVERGPFAPLSGPFFSRADGLFPVVHRLPVHPVYYAAAGKADEVGGEVPDV